MKTLGGIFDIDAKKIEIENLEKTLSDPNIWNNQSKVQPISKKLAHIKGIVSQWEEMNSTLNDYHEVFVLLKSEFDKSLFDELVNELFKIKESIDSIEFKRMLGESSDKLFAVLTINSGAGGTDSQDWAQMLLRMYTRWCEKKSFKCEMVDYQAGEEAGIKSVTLMINAEYAYGYLKAENGIHRIVRISPFDSNARRHTSFASVYASPQVDEFVKIEILDTDIKIDTYRSSGAGGQHVNTTDSAVRITHLSTGIVVQCQNERSQHKNKATALKLLKSKLYERQLQERQDEINKQNSSKKRIEWGSQIRSYVLHPYQLVKDHRTDFETGNIMAVLDGEIDNFIKQYLLYSADEKKV